MGQTYARKELYDLVWSEPLRTLCARFEVSDVSLKKACKRADIPTPPQGYWNKVHAGKKTSKLVLPLRRLGQSDEVAFGADR